MDPSKRIVTQMPRTELWTAEGPVCAARAGELGEAEVASLLHDARTTFVVASVGEPLRWIRPSDRYRFWKKEVKPRLVARKRSRSWPPLSGERTPPAPA